ncbi:hypothetical protein IFM89_018102 [Coptis chinensis]|uniref:Uncharacterized protein n=1 Tax=Coptis chinensis TaxID=261450 RepID=A0A835M577_9MAGN|nr:hypothetical protein IFM89_018102 [Coptis chinensis]
MRTKSVKAFVAIHAVNLRERMVPPLSNPFVLGNLNIGTMATSTTSEPPPELHSLVARLRKAIKKVDGDFVRKLQVDDGLSTYYSSTGEMMEKHVKGELQLFLFTSWCRFPFYEADFGWGKPIQITPVHLILNNTVILVDTKCGKGIEAWVSLDKKDMARFQCEPELTAFTSTSQG